jgi:hypothetical protein
MAEQRYKRNTRYQIENLILGDLGVEGNIIKGVLKKTVMGPSWI